MRTARVLIVSPSMLCGGVSAPGGCLLRGVSAPRGRVSESEGGVSIRGVSAPGGCLLPGGCVSQHALRQTPPCEQNS